MGTHTNQILLKELKKHEAKNMRHWGMQDAMEARAGGIGDAILLVTY